MRRRYEAPTARMISQTQSLSDSLEERSLHGVRFRARKFQTFPVLHSLGGLCPPSPTCQCLHTANDSVHTRKGPLPPPTIPTSPAIPPLRQGVLQGELKICPLLPLSLWLWHCTNSKRKQRPKGQRRRRQSTDVSLVCVLNDRRPTFYTLYEQMTYSPTNGAEGNSLSLQAEVCFDIPLSRHAEAYYTRNRVHAELIH